MPGAPSAGPVLYDQYGSPAGGHPMDITSQDFEPALDPADSEAADDFAVPAGGTWAIDAIDVDGEFFGRDSEIPVPTGFHVRFWSNNAAAGLPAALFAERLNQAYTATFAPGDVQIALNPPVALGEGTWWVSVQARLNYGSPSETRQWFWHHRTVQAGQGAAWRNPGDFWLSGCTQFSRRGTCQGSSSAPDQVFRLHGSVTTGPPPPPPPGPPPPPPPSQPQCRVPNVVGRTLGRAASLILRSHCRVGRVSRRRAVRQRRGKVIRQSPGAGRVRPLNTRVHLVVGR